MNRTVPKNSLAYLFPQGFNEFWQKLQFKQDLDQVIYHYVPATTDTAEIKRTLASGGYGLLAIPIAKHYFDRYQYSSFEPYEDVFIAKFKTNIVNVIAEVRRKEWLWQELFKDLKQYLKKVNLKTDTRTSQNYDKTLIQGGKTINQSKDNSQQSNQKQITSKNTPTFANVDLTSNNFGGFQRQNQLATQQNEQGQSSQVGSRNNTTTKQNHSNKEFYRANKDANVSITNQDSYELLQVLRSRLLSSFDLTIIKLADYYSLFDKLFIKFFGATVQPIIDRATGQRKWVSQVEYEELIQEESGTRPISPTANEWDESLPYLERLKIYKAKVEQELKKLPPTSNRLPRIALRDKVLEGCVKAYEPEYISLPTPELFLQRIRGEVESYQKVIGYENIIDIVVKYLKSYHFSRRYNIEAPAQLMIMLLGEPGLGKTYISKALARALGRGYHMVGMNGKPHASLIMGTNIENPGAEPGEILKAISRSQDRSCLIIFDELEKAKQDARDAVGVPTDITTNMNFKDDFLDFPTPTNQCIFMSAINDPDRMPGFLADRFAVKIEVKPLPYWQRIEVVQTVLQSELKKLNNALQILYHQNWQEIYSLFNHEELLKKTLTWTFSIRGAKNNILLKLIPTIVSDFLALEQPLPTDLINYPWNFLQREGVDEKCPYALDKRNNHQVNCKCFTQNLDKVLGWVENMGNTYHD